MTLLDDVKITFYKAIKGDISLSDFEQWLYSDRELEKFFRPDYYLELITFNFEQKGADYELRELLKKQIDLGEFETYKLLELLKEAQQKNDRLPYILMEFYDLYCKGYEFLQELGLNYGLAVAAPSDADFWEELTPEQQNELSASFSPELDKCIQQVIDWLETKNIVLTGEKDETGRYLYKYLRL